MKRIAIAAAVLLLAGCSSPSEKVAGQVVSCESISSSTTKNSLFLDCLDGGVGASIDSIKGPAIINVWGSWCSPCKEEMPILRSFYEKAQGKVLLIGVDVEEASLEDGRKFVENNGITWPNLFDADGRSRAYFGMGVPVTWFIASDGSVAYKHIGVLKNEIDLISLTSKYLGVKL
jgi:cytochrome c biogenesis protein CcmG/thiol:disulfide interchange protein DsbE